jgi:hypothetical protein
MSMFSEPTPIKINGRQYYFKNIPPSDDSGACVHFYVKIKKTKTIKKRKFWFFGPVLSTIQKEFEELNFAFKTFQLITETERYDINDIKAAEELYWKKCLIKAGRLEV